MNVQPPVTYAEHLAVPAALAEVRSRPCPLCEALPGEPCQPKPAADHLARWLDAHTSGHLARAYMARVVGELIVIDLASTVVPAQRGGAR